MHGTDCNVTNFLRQSFYLWLIDICNVTVHDLAHLRFVVSEIIVNQRATLKTVAEACGLAVTTVSRALNNHDDIAPGTRERVQRVASDIGYVPNREGRALRTGQSHLISLVVPPHSSISGYTSSIIFSLGAVLRDHGYELCALPAYPDEDELNQIRSIVENRRADGVILTRTEPQDVRVRYLIEQGIPFVTHGRTELASAHAYVDFDNQAFAEQAAKRLIDRGCKRLMLIGPPAELTYANHMYQGFQRAVTCGGIDSVPTPDDLSFETPLASIREQIEALMASQDAPDGIVCGGEFAALAVIASLRDDSDPSASKVPVIAKQTSSVFDHTYPPIDTLYEDIDAAGVLLAESILSLLRQQGDAKSLSRLLKPQTRWRTDGT